MKEILLSTRNPGKARELQQLLGQEWKVQTVLNFPTIPEAKEDGSTFRDNAIKKAVEASQHVDCLVLADDSGLEVDALGGKPGVHSARYAGTHGDDDANNRKLLIAMKDVPDENRGAQFHCVLALAQGGQILHTTDGIVRGRIARDCIGTGGFGYDPLFIPVGQTQTFGELSSQYKNEVSHRARATLAMVAHLRQRRLAA